MVIDSHTHIVPKSDIFNSWAKSIGTTNTVDGLLEEMEKNQVSKALVFASYLPEFWLTNEELLEMLKGHDELIPVASVDGRGKITKEMHSELKDLLSTEQFKAVKLYTGYWYKGPEDKGLEKIYDLCAHLDMPVIFHTGDTFVKDAKLTYAHPLRFDSFAVDHRDLKIILAHMGNPFVWDAMAVLYKNQNVYADISDFAVGEPVPAKEKYIDVMANEVRKCMAYMGGPDKLLFGSDWPLATIKDSLDFVKRLGVSDDEYKILMQENAKKLFKL